MKRADVIDAFAEVRGDAVVITGPGASSGTLFVRDHKPGTIYNMELGYAAAMCLGMAIAAPDLKVVAIEGDGSMIVGLPVLTTIARYSPPNLTVLVIDNGVYGTGGGTVQTAAGRGTDIAAVARACGLSAEHVVETSTKDQSSSALARAVAEPGPWLIVAHVDPSDASMRPNRPRPGIDIVESAAALRRSIAESRAAR